MNLFCARMPRTACAKRVLALALGLAAAVPSAMAVELEVAATSNKRLLDPEFNMGKGLFTWVDIVDGSIWVSGIDRVTGAFVPESGKGVLIERGAAPYGGLGFTLNGPEWVYGASGDTLVYTRFTDRTSPTPANAQIGVSFQNSNGKWVLRTLSGGRPLNAPYGSEWAHDPAPRITYNDAQGNHYWRELNNPDSEELIPGTPQGLLPAVRHVRGDGERALVYPIPVGGVPQVHWYRVDTKVLEQITFDPVAKDQPWMWRAPDFGNDLVMLTTSGDYTLELHRRAAAGDGTYQWSLVRALQAPLGGKFFSTEPFIYGGKSYVVMMVIVGAYPTSIWLADFDAAASALRRLTPEWPDRARADPEVFFTDRGPVVFYSRFNQNKGTYWLCVPCAEGLYRADTGIAPQ